jgi:pyridoxamine 5'-phosphate oxidase
VVLLKDIAEDGFVFYTNYNSDKAQALTHHPAVSLSFFWPNVERQVLISGMAKRASDALSDAYFSSRPRGSQLGAHVSPQSQVIESRQVLSERLSKLTTAFKDKQVPRPSNWGGIVVVPNRMEFWQGRPNRLHDRIVYIKSNQDSWTRNRLAP